MNLPTFPPETIQAILPFAVLAVGGTFVSLAGAWRSRLGGLFSLIILAVCALTLRPLAGLTDYETWRGALVADRFSFLLSVLLLISGALSVLISGPVLRRENRNHAEYYGLLLFSLSGMILLVSTTNLLMLFIALELLSLPLYILCGFNRDDARGGESALKYFLLGSFSSAIYLYGAALLFGATGTIDIAAMSGASGPLAIGGVLLIMSGFLFKVAVVPFHMWAPDVYDGAPTPITAFMATSVKVACFGVLLRFFALGVGGSAHPFHAFLATEGAQEALSWLAILTMTIGNISALTQSNIKRMLAFSSVAHAGYLMLGLIPGRGGVDGSAMLYYLMAYVFMTAGAFAVVVALSTRDRGREVVGIERFAGVGFRRPFLGIAMTVCMISLAGIPPTAGFFGKYLLFRGAIERGLTSLVVVAVINSAISVYYYLRPVVVFYMRDTDRPVRVDDAVVIRVALAIGVFVLLWSGFAPDLGSLPGVPSILGWMEASAATLP